MNEPAFGDRMRRALDEGLDHLPDDILARLAQARGEALARLPGATRQQARGGTRNAPSGTRWTRRLAAARTRRWQHPLSASLVMLACVASLLAVWHWSDLRQARDIAALDVAMLADGVPLAVYADRGFGVFMRNTGR